MDFEKFCGSEFWDESLTWNTPNPDFTPCFQKTILVWVPCGLLWVFLPLEIYFIHSSTNTKLPWTGLNVTRMVLGGFLTILSLMEVVDGMLNYWDSNVDIPYANINSPFLSALTYFLATILMLINRKRGCASSGVLFFYWLLSTLATTVIFRSRMMNALDPLKREHKLSFLICSLSYPMIVAELILFSFADSEIPARKKIIEKRNPCPETKSTLLVRLMFAWFDKMTWLGFKKPLIVTDLWDLAPNNLSQHVVSHFQIGWQKDLQNYQQISSEDPRKKIKPPSILSALWKTFRWPFVLAGILRITNDMLAFVSPLILQLLIAYVSADEPVWRGYFYAAVLFSATLVQSCINGQQYLLMYNLAMRVRSTIISAIYQKSLKINNTVKRTSTVGEIVNLMAVDAQRVMDVMPELHIIWSALIQISVALFLLWGQLGPSVLAGLGVMILMIPINALIAGRYKGFQVKNMKFKDKRVKIMNEIFNGIKVLKLYAWEDSFSTYVSGIRNDELHVMKKAAYLNAVASFCFTSTPFLITLVTFATYVLVDEHNVLDPSKAFVSLSLFNIIRFPMFLIPMLFIALIQSSVSFKRLNKFLTSDELDFTAITHNENTEFPIVVEKASFSWDPLDTSASSLKDINLHVPEGNLIAIVGSVGSGKSSLLSAILGDMEKISGQVNTKGSIAYVAQQAWIQNATLKDNILFNKPYDEQRYKSVLNACALEPDLLMLPAGDRTEIGEKGINLSGGQKQRVSLARAVYSDADIIIMDDPLSAVDSHVGKHIFEKVMDTNGLLKGKTRLLVTNSITYLPRMDSIVVMNSGRITEMGTYDELLERKGDFATFLMTYLQEHDKNELSEEELTDLEGITKDRFKRIGSPEIERKLSMMSPTSDVNSDTENEQLSSSSRLLRKYSSHSNESNALQRQISTKVQASQLIQGETAETGKVKWSIYFEYARAVGLLSSFFIASLNILSTACTVGSNIWLSEWSEDPPLVNNTQDIALRDKRLGVYGALGAGQAIFNFGASLIMFIGTINASRILHSQMLLNVLKCPMSFFDTTPLGRIVNRFSKDVDIVDITVPRILRPLIGTLLQVLSTLVVISISTPIFMSVIVPLGIIFYIIQRFYISTSRQLKRLESITRSPIFSHFSETLSGASTIRAYGRTQNFIQESEFRVDNNHVCYYPSVVANRWLSIRLELLSNVIVFCAALFAVLSRDTLDPGTVGLSISYAASMTQVLTMLVRMACDLESNIVAVERMQEYAETTTEAAFHIEAIDPKPDWPDKGIIFFQQYSTRYRPGLELVLKNISCHIQAGEKIGIVGRTGAGKSSLTLALFRIIEPADGCIFIDGVNTRIIGLHALRSKITIIPQDPVLFSGTLRMNLDPFGKYSDDQLWKALELSHLKNFVSTLPQTLEHYVAEGGENLSVGQRQLVCLARAVLRKTKILVLDEATAAVDLETDDLIQATIRAEFAQCTVLTIAHRINTIMDSTRIIVLDRGQIQEFDSPTVLLQNKKSIFFGMAKDEGLI